MLNLKTINKITKLSIKVPEKKVIKPVPKKIIIVKNNASKFEIFFLKKE